MKALWPIVTLLLAVLLLAACGGPKTVELSQAPALTAESEKIRLSKGDNFQLLVFGQENFSGRFQVGKNGKVNLPGVGEIKAAGRTIRDFEERIAKRLGRSGIANPQVSVLLASAGFVQIFGAVAQPGEYAFRENMDLSTVIFLAGGYTQQADPTIVFIVSSGSLAEVAYPVHAAPSLAAGDVIRIPLRR